ncbi:hypothetical protein [Methylomarinovum tepidoasis]|uniref:hypothetical protein n=1 Tax=Methylomarinovum tepidoasis TaxID=2840183 RepID=UPI0025735F42|nr:hypothetical protein [Methylomarinovum sp. IN45]
MTLAFSSGMKVRKFSKYLLSFEIGFFVLLITILYLLGASVVIWGAYSYPSLGSTVLVILLLLSGISIYSIWHLGYRILYIKEHDVLQCKWNWRFIFMGAFISVLSLISNNIPIENEYSEWGSFSIDFNNLVLGLPLFLVAAHIRYEATKC